jgi:hypothetical protein
MTDYYKGIKRLSSTNDVYIVWKEKVMGILEENDVLVCIDDPSPEPLKEEATTSRPTWLKDQVKARNIILRYISGDIESDVIEIRNPNLLWNAIKKKFVDRPEIEKNYSLHRIMRMVMREDETLNAYVQRFKVLKNKCVEIGWKLDDSQYAIALISGLHQQHSVLSQVLMNKGTMGYLDACEALITESRKILQTHSPDDHGFVTKDHLPKQRVCGYCGKSGHIHADCYMWKKILSRLPEKGDDHANIATNGSINSSFEYALTNLTTRTSTNSFIYCCS